MPKKLNAALLFAGLTLSACGSSSASNPYDLAADQVDQAASALTSSTPDDTFAALSDTSAAGSAATETGAAGGAAHRQRGEGRGHGKGRGGPGGGMNGQQLLLWYVDLGALQACRDQRASCGTGDDAGTCEQAARECVKPLLQAAFSAFCTDKLAMCSEASAAEAGCERIKARCTTSTTSDAGT